MKRLAWFIFKSPQRKWVGWHSLFTDFTGSTEWLLNGLLRPNRNKTVWVCVGIKDRTEPFLTHLLPSLAAQAREQNLALSVWDCGSIDASRIESAIQQVWPTQWVFHSSPSPFARSMAFNKAMNLASGELLFACDADMTVPDKLGEKVRRNTGQRYAWFPVCQWQLDPEKEAWKWFSAGTGLFSATKKQLESTGGYDEGFTEWGKEDWDLFFRFYAKGIMPLRTRCDGLYHHWHPSSKPDNFIPMF